MYTSDGSHTIKQHLTRSRKKSVHPESYPIMVPIQPHPQFCRVIPVKLHLECGSDKKVTVLEDSGHGFKSTH